LRNIQSEDNDVRSKAKEDLKKWKYFISNLQSAIYSIPGFQNEVLVYRGQSFIPPSK
jgi:hypothetical protein